MRVLVFAYRGEAQAFMSGYKLSKELNDLYIKDSHHSDDPAIFFSKEGVESTLYKMTLLMQKFPNINEIINLGIVGGLNKSLKPLDIIEVQTSYCHIEGQSTRHQSFVLSSNKDYPYTCMTSHLRVFETEQKEYLSKFADVVDRELWAIGYVMAKYPKVSLKSVKCIADASEDPLECKEIIVNAKRYSEALKEYYLKNFDKGSPSKNQGEMFVITQSQSVLYRKYKAKLLIDWGENQMSVREQGFLNSLPSKMHSKQRIKPLLEWMEKKAYPELVELKEKAKAILKPLKSDQSSFSFDERLDHQTIDFKCQIRSKDDFNQLKETFNHFDYDKWLQFFGKA